MTCIIDLKFLKEFFIFSFYLLSCRFRFISVERNVNESVANPQLLLGVKPFHTMATTAIFCHKDSVTMWTPAFGATIPIYDVNIWRHQSKWTDFKVTLKQKVTPCLDVFLPPATKLRQGYVFTGICDSVHRGAYVAMGHAWGACMVGGGIHGRGCMVGGRHRGGHAWQGGRAWQEKRPLQWAVRILLTCILVVLVFEKLHEKQSS